MKYVKNQDRIIVIDLLRGFVLIGILLLHHIEHFDFYLKPEFQPEWLVPIDKWVWEKLFLFFSGKAFALFSLLFGFSYWLMYENAKHRGERYFGRHIWRMCLLAIFGALHIIFFRGDILLMYAVLGMPLIFSRYMNNKVILSFAILLILNPIKLYAIIFYGLSDESFNLKIPYPKLNINQVLSGNSFWDLLKVNFNAGYSATIIWTWNVGRFMTIPGLFLLGIYFAKTKRFTEHNIKFWYKLLLMSLTFWLALDLLTFKNVINITQNESKVTFKTLTDSYIKLLMMFSMLSIFVISWLHNKGNISLIYISSFGRMGLTNYILMSIIGAILYYGWGLGLYKYFGSTVSLLLGVFVLMIQILFSNYWLTLHKQGPLEMIWRRLTLLNFK